MQLIYKQRTEKSYIPRKDWEVYPDYLATHPFFITPPTIKLSNPDLILKLNDMMPIIPRIEERSPYL